MPRQRPTIINSRHQVTIPTAVLNAAVLQPGDRVLIRAGGHGKLVLETALTKYAGIFTGAYPPDALNQLRDEWEH